MRTIADKRLATAADAERRRADNEALNQKFRDLFASDLGQEVLAHLENKFQPRGRRFGIAAKGGPPMDPFAAAVRDGEAAVINYVKSRIENA